MYRSFSTPTVSAPFRVITAFLLLFAVAIVFPGTNPLRAAASISDEDPDVITLINTKHFGFGEIDKEGRFPEGEIALKRIMKREGGQQQLFVVFDRATLAGKCYALVGIRLFSPATFPEFVKKLDPWKGLKIRTAAKDQVIEEKLADVIRMIETGIYGEYVRVCE